MYAAERHTPLFTICNNMFNIGVALLSDKVWNDLSEHFNYVTSPAALHVFIKSNRRKLADQLKDINTNECLYLWFYIVK